MSNELSKIFNSFIKEELKNDPSLILDSYDGKIDIEWEDNSPVTPYGNLSFFIEYLKVSGLFDALVSDFPLNYTSNSSSKSRDLIGTTMLSILSGHKRYAHITSLRNDKVNPDLLGMSKICSEDSVRRCCKKLEESSTLSWIKNHLNFCYRPLLNEDWILDVDTTVKCLYGKQEGAVVGYNPTKPGRPSHTYHTYMIANLRIILGVDILPGNQNHSIHTLPHLFDFLDKLPESMHPSFIRGDIGFGTDNIIKECESRNIGYLFKLRCSKNVKSLISKLMSQEDWHYTGQGWEGRKSLLKLSGWNKERSVVVIRRLLKDKDIGISKKSSKAGQASFDFIKNSSTTNLYEYAVLVTSMDNEVFTIAQHYRDRADSENAFDELKNQWGWGGFVTQDLKRCRIMANLTALFYNWWSLFSRLCIPGKRHEAITGRPLLMGSVGRMVNHARKKTLKLSIIHGSTKKAKQALIRAHTLLRNISLYAEQLSKLEIWRCILSAAMRFFLKGRLLKPPPEGIDVF
jgi:hypothetical protein